MKLLFIQGGSRWKFDQNNKVYTDANFNENVWNRYRSICSDLTVILKQEEKIYHSDEAGKRFNYFDTNKSRAVSVPDIYRPIKRFFNLKDRKLINHIIEEEVLNADIVIIRSIGTYYTNTALKYVRKNKKPYLVEETGFSFEALWYHSLPGKIVAIPNEISTKILMRDVPWAIYVTNEALQKRYPCSGKSIGCSDVEIDLDEEMLNRRLAKTNDERIVLGTAAFLDVGWKGQIYVIRALARLQEQGIDNFEYQLIGAGTGNLLRKEAEKLGISDKVRIIGALPHDQVFEWLDNIDVYIQSSFMEGLCRSIIEAMSRACPVLCTDVGGNYELIDENCLMKKGNTSDIVEKLKQMLSADFRRKQSCINFEKAKKYEKTYLNNKRNAFYKEFIDSKTKEGNLTK